MNVTIYGRVSTEEQKKKENIDSQVDELEKLAKESKGEYSLINDYKYLDDGWSGGILNRPALDKLREDATRGLFSAVLVNDVDRLSRDNTHLGIIIKDLRRNGVRVIFRKHPGEQNPQTNLLINILGSYAEFEKEMIAGRTRRGRMYKAQVLKKIVGSRPPYGYRYIKGDKSKNIFGYYEVVPSEAEVVKMMFNWVAYEKKTAREVVRELTRRKIPTKKKNTKWAKSTVLRILHRTDYICKLYYNKQECVETDKHINTDLKPRKQLKSGRRTRPIEEWILIPLPEHLRIISDKTFDLVQKSITNNLSFSPRNGKREYLLRGRVYCGLCGCLYQGIPCHGKTYYRCGNRGKTFPEPRTCFAPTITTSKLDQPVWEALTRAIQNPRLIVEQVKKIKSSRYSEEDKIRGQIDELAKQVNSYDQEEERVLEAYRHKVITLEQLNKEMTKIRQERAVFIQQRDELLAKLSKVLPEDAEKSVIAYCAIVKAKLEKMSFTEKQQLLRLLVSKIVLQDKRFEIDAEIPLVDSDYLKSFKNSKILENDEASSIRNISSCFPDPPVQAKPCWRKPSPLFYPNPRSARC